ncbi:MAG: ABC transporter ATP-binding protein [Magnetococcales bacterium]|nr:ABC transporter ATP-binding protein [Magnetococcales bacterium]
MATRTLPGTEVGPRMIHLDMVDYSLVHGGQTLPILKQVSLSVARGQVVGLLGPSGSGKSTLLALLAGVERPTQGRIQVNGVAFDTLSTDALARFRRQHLGIVFQDFHLVPTLTAWENVALPLDLAGLPDSRPQAMAMLEQVGLAHRTTHRPAELSGGEQQRVAIARAFVSRPALILADEPTGNLDQNTSRHIIDLLFSFAKQWSTTLFLVTHDPQLAGRTDQQFYLRDGRLAEHNGCA